ncbi:hypothetical protein DESUT3_37670 [Desulfuromonas versatilis]|uniref:Plastocyanin-like domain-containing protein n=1 Tax=Desulfuromonas versatilis TaxID=2802975 RepID=A0ABN6E2X3_9BACT|nr:multicopper oxidase family protein [Desulfuromonas versatilis]BCR06698.1 hypothetical protein DESUT3_37670 [Desulfuromonas versatilis]
MNYCRIKTRGRTVLLTVVLLLCFAATGMAKIDGVTDLGLSPVFNLTAKPGHVSTPDGNSIYFWGYADNTTGQVQYPGPTLIVRQGATVTINLTNNLAVPTSMVFPGQKVTASGGTPGLLASEAAPTTGTVSYTFTATNAGTYTYYSGTQPDLQGEMGLFGALIVRPNNFNAASPTAYGAPTSAYDNEYLFLLSEMDPDIHMRVEMGFPVDTTANHPVNWFINGRGGPDTVAPAGAEAAWLPTQPYNCFPRATPGQRVLLRFIGGGRDGHPLHTHGNNFDLIARDGRALESAVGAARAAEVGVVPDLAVSDFTQSVFPGATYDAIFTWTGKNLGWDIYGTTDKMPHTCVDSGNGFDATTHEWCADHDKPLPVILPDIKDLVFGQFYSGSPYLGAAGQLPPGEGGFNQNAGFFFMWHSHNEKELTNNDIFPGGMMSMFVVEPPGTVIVE